MPLLSRATDVTESKAKLKLYVTSSPINLVPDKKKKKIGRYKSEDQRTNFTNLRNLERISVYVRLDIVFTCTSELRVEHRKGSVSILSHNVLKERENSFLSL